jgi:hypothetical protein
VAGARQQVLLDHPDDLRGVAGAQAAVGIAGRLERLGDRAEHVLRVEPGVLVEQVRVQQVPQALLAAVVAQHLGVEVVLGDLRVGLGRGILAEPLGLGDRLAGRLVADLRDAAERLQHGLRDLAQLALEVAPEAPLQLVADVGLKALQQGDGLALRSLERGVVAIGEARQQPGLRRAAELLVPLVDLAADQIAVEVDRGAGLLQEGVVGVGLAALLVGRGREERGLQRADQQQPLRDRVGVELGEEALQEPAGPQVGELGLQVQADGLFGPRGVLAQVGDGRAMDGLPGLMPIGSTGAMTTSSSRRA